MTTSTGTYTATQIKAMNVTELVTLDIEFARRATALGRTGVVSKTHKAIRTALAAR
jgi:hypothetical protein